MPEFQAPVPILRIFDEEKARAFYVDWLGFAVDWEHRFEPEAPLYLQVSLGDVRIQLSEHHGDACPGSSVVVPVVGIDDYHEELTRKRYRYYRASVQAMPWGTRDMTVQDPFGNRLVFREA